LRQKVLGVFTGKRKTAVARLVIKPGKGRVIINNTPLDLFGNELVRAKILTPLYLAPDYWKNHDFIVKAHGGGPMAMAEAIAIAIARGLASVKETIKQAIIEYDRVLIAGDPRRTEPKKPNRRSARRFKQKSYR